MSLPLLWSAQVTQTSFHPPVNHSVDKEAEGQRGRPAISQAPGD